MTQPVGRRDFLSRVTLSGLAAGVAPFAGRPSRPGDWLGPSLDAAETFRVAPDDPDDKVFAAARRQFLFPTSVTYCNTGTLGASPRPVVDALNGGVERLEHDLPDWPYFQADGEPLTGYQELKDVRTTIGEFIGATADEIALTGNATMGMSFLANGLDLAAGDEVLSTDQEHTGGIGGWRLRAKRHGVVVKELPLLPMGIYTIPEISAAGLTEEQCKKANIPYVTGRNKFGQHARGQIIGDTEGMIKLIFSAPGAATKDDDGKPDFPDGGKLLGVSVIGEMASELVHTGMACLHFGGGVDYFIESVFNYPTLSDVYKYAAFDALGQLNKLRGDAPAAPMKPGIVGG